MNPVEHARKRHLRNEFIKSGAILLLAVILLVSAVLAWFGDEATTSIAPFYLAIKSEDNGTELGQDIVTEKSVVLPSATKLGDPEISVSDFSKAIKVMPLEVESPMPNNVSISITVPKGLHYYIDTDYVKGTDTDLSYAQIINDNHKASTSTDETVEPPVSGNDEDVELVYVEADHDTVNNVYKHMVAIVFWADYHHTTDNGKTYGEIINENGTLELNALMSFKIVLNNG